jgi:hypothetical protein
MRLAFVAAALLLGASVAASAAPKGTSGPGASEYTPGDTMHDKATSGQGASKYAPEHLQKKPGGASELSPGDRMNDKR